MFQPNWNVFSTRVFFGGGPELFCSMGVPVRVMIFGLTCTPGTNLKVRPNFFGPPCPNYMSLGVEHMVERCRIFTLLQRIFWIISVWSDLGARGWVGPGVKKMEPVFVGLTNTFSQWMCWKKLCMMSCGFDIMDTLHRYLCFISKLMKWRATFQLWINSNQDAVVCALPGFHLRFGWWHKGQQGNPDNHHFPQGWTWNTLPPSVQH